MTIERIIDLWKIGVTIKKLSQQYKKQQKRKKVNISIEEAQRYIEPIIYKYQTELMK